MRKIDADELLKSLHSTCEICNEKGKDWCEHCCPQNDFEDLIDNAPTIEDKTIVYSTKMARAIDLAGNSIEGYYDPSRELFFSKFGIIGKELLEERNCILVEEGVPGEEGGEESTDSSKWIPVTERLPEEMEKVLIWFEYYRYGDYNCMFQTYGFGYVIDGKWSPFINGETGWRDYNILAWMPLPKPYESDEQGGAV